MMRLAREALVAWRVVEPKPGYAIADEPKDDDQQHAPSHLSATVGFRSGSRPLVLTPDPRHAEREHEPDEEQAADEARKRGQRVPHEGGPYAR